ESLMPQSATPHGATTQASTQVSPTTESATPQTAAEKLLSRKAGYAVEAGDIVVVPADNAMATDATAPFAIKAFENMGATRVWDPSRMALILDHATPAPNERISTL